MIKYLIGSVLVIVSAVLIFTGINEHTTKLTMSERIHNSCVKHYGEISDYAVKRCEMDIDIGLLQEELDNKKASVLKEVQ